MWFAGGGTGGHLYPGLAIARALKALRPDVEPFFVGAKRGIERDILPSTEFGHVLLDLHPLYRAKVWNNWKTMSSAVGAWRQLGALARRARPSAIVGTGGYASGLALAYAAAHRIPYVLQEQNSYPGLTMRFFSRWAREVYLGYPEAERYLEQSNSPTLIDTGNPIEPPPRERPLRAVARRQWGLPATGGHVLLVFGGSQGSRAINTAVADWLRSGARPPDLYIVWATGKGTYDEFSSLAGDGVVITPYIAPMRDAYAAADLAIARAGAMGTAELCAWGIPAILVPLPTAAADHQAINARTLAAVGAAIYIPQIDFTAKRLDQTIRDLLAQPDELARLAAGAAARARPDAALDIAKRIATIMP
ncbi:MAG TPA: UDP-N-acetylglucosamine--N-acetylmuramyl-(pentapeptide) pyrophosphoryl-undecaprenol N-acetylglucosamine transferase [Gemmatimonadaceae bacterium]|nr:UDP-N-acetylglucosamine--N-acetylmuramyl-(pentapeptide) pyrophosphoryl-undecaprenol N-acetylglucosamine transferase [Gemmatimonadaceae bacterium]